MLFQGECDWKFRDENHRKNPPGPVGMNIFALHFFKPRNIGEHMGAKSSTDCGVHMFLSTKVQGGGRKG